MNPTGWRDLPIRGDHDRRAFDCGEAALNDYLARHARQNHERGSVRTFVAEPIGEPTRVMGFYTIGFAVVEPARVPESMRKGHGRYDVPMFRLARLAVDRASQGRGLGADLLFAAGRRCISAFTQVGGLGLLIDAKNFGVADWYRKFGAVALEDSTLSLVMPLKVFGSRDLLQ